MKPFEEGQLGRASASPVRTMSRTGADGLGLEGGVGGLGHNWHLHPVRNRRPGIFGYRDEIVQAFKAGAAIEKRKAGVRVIEAASARIGGPLAPP